MRANRRPDVPWWRQPFGELQRASQLRLRGQPLTWHLDDQTARLDLRMLHRLGQRQHGFDAGIKLSEDFAPLREITLLELDLDLALERALILGLLRQTTRRQFGAADGGAELLHELRFQAADREPATVARAVVVVEAAAIERLVFHARLDAGTEVTGARHTMQAERAVGHAHIDLLPHASGLALHHSRKQADHAMQRAARQVGQLYAERQRAAVAAPGVAGNAGQRQVVDVVPGAITIRPTLAITGDRHVDQPWVDRLECLVTDAQLVHHAGTKLFEHDVVLADQLLDHLHRFGPLEIEGDAAFVAVEVGVTGGGSAIVRRQHAHQIHTRGRLYPQDLGAHVGQQQRGERPRQQGGEVENFQRRQWAGHGDSRFACLT